LADRSILLVCFKILPQLLLILSACPIDARGVRFPGMNKRSYGSRASGTVRDRGKVVHLESSRIGLDRHGPVGAFVLHPAGALDAKPSRQEPPSLDDDTEFRIRPHEATARQIEPHKTARREKRHEEIAPPPQPHTRLVAKPDAASDGLPAR